MPDLQKEIEDIRVLMEKKADKDILPVLQTYKKALQGFRGELGTIYMKYSSSNGVLNISTQQRYSVLKSLERKLKDIAKELGNIDEKKTTEILKDVYSESYYRTAYAIDKGVDVTIDFSILKPEFIKSAIETPMKGEMYSDRIWKNKEKLINRLRNNIEQGITQGKSIDKLAKDIKDTFGTAAFESKRLIHNEMSRVISAAQKKIYAESEIVSDVIFTATLDEKTSERCQDLDGKIFSVEEAPDIPSDTHVGCRSCLIPKIKGWNPSKRRDNESKDIIDYKTYNDWYKNKVQNDEE